ncbi:MAG: hypothetical protein GC168_07845 [Candidatus Hydrogenedens sp.]|nr:hypothetical protein [Candidatus Hydrogenedens sp.]
MASKPKIEYLLQGYIDDELSTAERVILERELSEDSALEATLKRQQDTAALLFETMGERRLDKDLCPAVMAHLPEMEGSQAYTRVDDAQEANWRAKHPSSSRWRLLAFAPAVASMLVVVLGLAIWYAWPPATNEERTLVGMVTGSWNDVLVHDEGTLQTYHAPLMQLLRQGDAIETGPDGSALVGLPGPSFIKAGPDTRFRIINARTIHVEKGKAWFSVAKHEQRFRVRTPEAVVTVFGTKFSVEANEAGLRVVLDEGEVTLENGEGFVVMYPGEQATLKTGETEIVKTSVDTTEALAWTNSIESDPAATREFLSVIPPLSRSVLRAEKVWWVDTNNFEGRPGALSLAWAPVPEGEKPLSYDMLVYDENMNPLFSRRLEPSLFLGDSPGWIEIAIPADRAPRSTTAFVRLVPNVNHGNYEVNFTEVTVIAGQ